MNDTIIFAVGLGVMGLVMASTYIALLASDHPEKFRGLSEVPYANPVSLGDASARQAELISVKPARV